MTLHDTRLGVHVQVPCSALAPYPCTVALRKHGWYTEGCWAQRLQWLILCGKVGKEQREKNFGSPQDVALQSTAASCGEFQEFEAQRFWADTQPHSATGWCC